MYCVAEILGLRSGGRICSLGRMKRRMKRKKQKLSNPDGRVTTVDVELGVSREYIPVFPTNPQKDEAVVQVSRSELV